MTFGLTPAGFNAMRLADVKQFLENAFVAQFGEINLSPQSVFGQEIGVLSKSFADLWENLEDVYLSQYPNSASGVALDNVVGINGITRLPATQTSVLASCNGLEGTYINQNALASIQENGQNFYANLGGFITAGNAVGTQVLVQSVAAQAYQILLTNQSFIYSFPIITFSNTGDIFQSSCSILATINGVTQTSIPFTTDSNTTLAALTTQITNFNGGLSCVATATNPNIITIVPNIGFSIVVNSILVTDGASNPTYIITFTAPGNQNLITAGLTALLNSGTPQWTAIDGMNGVITINANSPTLPFNINVGVNLLINYISSPINFLCVDFGPIPCPIDALTNILTPISGWQGITNTIAGTLGTLVETDAALRIRRNSSIALSGDATPTAIRAGLLQNVSGVTSVTIYENITLIQQDVIITFPALFQEDDVITFSYAPSQSFPVDYDENQITTMADLVAAVEALPQVASASYGGSGNKTLTISMNIFQDLTVTSVTTNISDQTAIITGGLPPKSFEAVVQGGNENAIANQIWKTKPAGIETYGNIGPVEIIDSQGNPQYIYYSAPQIIYIWVTVALTLYSGETFPVNGLLLVQQAILNYINNLGVGVDVLLQRVTAQIFTVPGIASGVTLMSFTTSLSQSPGAYSDADITIGNSQIAETELTLINVTVS